MKIFNVTFKPTKKYNDFERTVKVTVAGTLGDTVAPQAALEIFMRNFGNLKKNEIIKIQQINENGENIGEPIVPQGDSAIIPVK